MFPSHKETYHQKQGFHKHRTKIIIFVIFIAILSILIYTSFGGFKITGGAVNEGVEVNDSIFISADLNSVPQLSLDGKFERVRINGAGSSFYVEDEEFSLSNFDNTLILHDYDGKIFFNETGLNLKGKASGVSVNGVPVTPKSRDTLKVSLEDHLSYNTLKIEDEVYIKTLEYTTSGIIRFGGQKAIIDLDNETLVLEKFKGDLDISDRGFMIYGSIESLDIQGAQKISVSV